MRAAALVNTREVRMREFRGAAETGELRVGAGRVCADQFDGEPEALIAKFGEENGAMLRAAELLDQAELPVDELAFLLFPSIGHVAPTAFERRAIAPGARMRNLRTLRARHERRGRAVPLRNGSELRGLGQLL